MIRLIWKAGSKLLEENGPIVAIVSFISFMSWMLFWPHGVSMSAAVGQEPEMTMYEKIKSSYSAQAAELLRVDEDVFLRSLSILDAQRFYCLLAEHFGDEGKSSLRPSYLLRYEALCNVFADAASMVDTYADRLSGGGGFYPKLHEFMFHSQKKEQVMGPFLTQEECVEIAERLIRLGERVSRCNPYGMSRSPTLYSSLQ
ncbi:MAG: hypothetical protein ACXIU5_13505 [Halomonadaceae bacterium]|jgi:hypothetical protein|uniref:hypothetical protein n=1 Tax=Halomonas sp. MCCC 1A11062 TaxID=2733485 RepID=UPI001F4376E8|nr:hypothetical protein [Halomonas sp. MCCC 1A11062]MCE8039657.1 hypothetical protein [Halomonas sp. MCCC 1A11062]